MKVPGVVATALITALYAFLQTLTSGVSVLEGWWVPVAVAVLGVLLKWLEVSGQPQGGQRDIENDSKSRRFWLG